MRIEEVPDPDPGPGGRGRRLAAARAGLGGGGGEDGRRGGRTPDTGWRFGQGGIRTQGRGGGGRSGKANPDLRPTDYNREPPKRGICNYQKKLFL